MIERCILIDREPKWHNVTLHGPYHIDFVVIVGFYSTRFSMHLCVYREFSKDLCVYGGFSKDLRVYRGFAKDSYAHMGFL